MGIHSILFREAVHGNGTPEQLAKWMPDIDDYKLPGCFAMTELGHGSFVQGCETTATFDREKDQFVIHTPTDTATKWWIGGAAHSAIASVVYARLIIDNKDLGVYNFMVPLRRRDDFSLLPGVNVGDCGSKMVREFSMALLQLIFIMQGRWGIDNGWIQFSHVRIPRSNMLMRWAQVDRDGKFTTSPQIQLSYGALVSGRVSMVTNATTTMMTALTIAIRYSAARRQFPSGKAAAKLSGPAARFAGEIQLLDYSTHYLTLMPLLAKCFANHFAGEFVCFSFRILAHISHSHRELLAMNKRVMEQLSKGDTSQLQDLHAISAGMKAMSTWRAQDCIEKCRQGLGGHGFSAYSALPMLAADYGVNVTWEGANNVMAMQTARALVKAMRAVTKGAAAPIESSPMSYLWRAQSTLASKFNEKASQAVTLDTPIATTLEILSAQLAALEYCSTKAIANLVAAMEGHDEDTALARNGSSAVGCALLHCAVWTARTFLSVVRQMATASSDNTSVVPVLSVLCSVYQLSNLRANSSFMLEDSFITVPQVKSMGSALATQCFEIRKQAVPLVDSFALTDWMLKSPLGRYDGAIYSAYLDRVKAAPEAQAPVPFYYPIIDKVLHKHEVAADPWA